MDKLHNSSHWGVSKSKDVFLYEITNSLGACLKLSNYGASIVSLTLPNGLDVIIGEKTFEGFTDGKHPHFGHTTGRLAGRSDGSAFLWPPKELGLPQETYQLHANKAGNVHLHGGDFALGRTVWDASPIAHADYEGIRFHVSCPHLQGGYPGDVEIYTTIGLHKKKNTIHVYHDVSSTSIAPINLTNHAYFNLGDDDILHNTLTLHSSEVYEYDKYAKLTGTLVPVEHSCFDFQSAQKLEKSIACIQKNDPSERGGLDHVFKTKNIPNNSPSISDMNLVATLTSPNKNTLNVFSSCSAIVCYTSNTISNYQPTHNQKEPYKQFCALCLETQNTPGFLHSDRIPDSYATPEKNWRSFTEYEFNIH